MFKTATLVFIFIFVFKCLGQQIAKQKCTEYSAVAKKEENSPYCKVFDDKSTGVKIEPNEFPATAMLGYGVSGEVRYICDATLISDDTLISAGHCLQQKKYGRPTWARIGATHSTLGVEVEVKESFCHPQYSPGNDIALVKLKTKLNASYIPACLDTEGVENGARGIGVGRPIGRAYIKLHAESPIKSWLELRPSLECEETFPHQRINSKSTLCSKDPASGPGDCLSGPLYVSKERCTLSVAGVASFGKQCSNETSTGRTPSVYTRVSYYLPWIESVTWPSA